MIVSLENVGFSYGGNLIFGGVNFAVNEGEKIGLVGANGEGKTTLLKLLCGELEPESGRIFRKNGLRIGYLEQNGGLEASGTVKEEAMKVFSREIAAVKRLSELSSELAAVEYGCKEYAALSSKIESLKSYIAATDAYGVSVRADAVLNGMGFVGRGGDKIENMSGGEKTRLKLARLLLEAPDLLVLDEPTNHLDSDTLFWLEDYLSSFRGALLVVSHDRYFLDRTVSRTAELERGALTSFKGNYTKYKTLKAELVARREKEWLAQCEEIEKLQIYIDKNIVRATTAKSAQSRVKQLEKIEIKERPAPPAPPPVFSFGFSENCAERALAVTALDLTRGGKRLISDANFELKRGDRLALVGANGTGKTSLLKEISGGANRAVRAGRGVRFGVYDQENANLAGGNTVIAELWERHTGFTQTEIRAALARAGLTAEDMQKSVSSLSGGERAKLALCVLGCERANFLLLDEPTNHLDLPSRESLEAALKEFGGTLIVVSHDRYFLSAVATRVAEISDGKLTVFDCGYDGYLAEKREIAANAAREAEERARAEYEKKRDGAKKSRAARAAEARRRETAKRLEGEIAALEEEENSLCARLCEKSVAADFNETKRISDRLGEIKKSLDALYKEYESVI